MNIRDEMDAVIGAEINRLQHHRRMLCSVDETILAEAVKTFESREFAAKWLISTQVYLGEKSPVEVANTPEGVEGIRTLLNAIEHGIFL